QQLEEAKAARAKAEEMRSEETALLDSLMEKLRDGKSVKGGRAAGKRPSAKDRAMRPPPTPLAMLSLGGDGGNADTGDLARGMLAALKSDGFVGLSAGSDDGGAGGSGGILPIPAPMSPTKRRTRIKSDPLLAEELEALTNGQAFDNSTQFSPDKSEAGELFEIVEKE
ncbi:hypothetical protein FRC17_008000, partial [Serendipita sp. 399]